MKKSAVVLAAAFYLCSCAAAPGSSNNESAVDAQMNIRSAESFMPEQVRQVFRRSCESCHGFDGRGIAGVAPDLRRAASRSREDWEKYLRDARTPHPASQMPPLWLTADEMKAMAEYLADLTQQN